MASKNFSGILRDPLGTLASNDKYRFTHVSTTGEVVKGSTSYFNVDDTGAYNFDIEYGNVTIESYSELGKRWINQGTTTINADTVATTLPALLNALVPASDALILQLEQILNDAESAATESQASADAAQQAASSAEQSASDAADSAQAAEDALSSKLDASYMTLKIFQSPTDGGLTEIQTRTVNANEVYEVRKTSDDSLATIYSDKTGLTEIEQDGTNNVSDSAGVVEFYIVDGGYYVEVGGTASGVSVGHSVLAKVSSVSQVKSTPYPAGSVFYLSSGKRSGEFEVVAGDYSAQLAADPANAIFIPVQGDVLGESKIAMRRGVEDYASTDWFGIDGDGITDDSVLSQIAVDTCLSLGLNLQFSRPDNYYLFDNYVQVVGASEFTIRLDPKKSVLRTNGDFEGVEIYPFIDGQARQVAKHRCFFAIIDSTGVTVDGGQYICGNGDTAGFQHVTNSGNSASAILAVRCTDTAVKNTRIFDLLPDGVDGSVQDAGYEYRYTAILGVMTTGFTVDGNFINGVAYSGIESRIGCTDTKVIGNHVLNARAHLTQSTPNYAQIPTSAFGVNGFNRGVLVSGNTGRGERTDITVHSEATSVIGNTLIDVTKNKTISIRTDANGVVVTGNTLVCTGDAGDLAIDAIATNTAANIYGNTIINYVLGFKAGDYVIGYRLGQNTWINVQDGTGNAVREGLNAGARAENITNGSVFIGQEAGLLSDLTSQTVIGFRAGREAEGAQFTTMGHESGQGMIGSDNTFFGYRAGYQFQGGFTTAVGKEAGLSASGGSNTFLGANAGRLNSGSTNTCVGLLSGGKNTGDYNVFLGRVEDNDYSWTVAFHNYPPTANNQMQVGERHIELQRLGVSPSSPPTDSVRLYGRLVGGVLRLSAIFPNGNIVDVATDE